MGTAGAYSIKDHYDWNGFLRYNTFPDMYLHSSHSSGTVIHILYFINTYQQLSISEKNISPLPVSLIATIRHKYYVLTNT